ncbi:MAG: iron-containing alcohol dehydrogenase, partial [Clostridia bacterium]|nr:iron-containing alcohol dehydrogenase [Clostridia bacterium]
MNIESIKKSLKNCPCGLQHDAPLRRVEIGSGITPMTGRILREEGFGDRLLFVADDNTLAASAGISDALAGSGFELKKLIYPDMKYATAERVEEIEALCGDVDAVISVGSGSLNDICRVPAARRGLPFCIFATAPSMDGFASGTSPIMRGNYKETWQAEQPAVIIADTDILAAAPTELKAAGLGDMIAKYIAITDWKISSVLTGEVFCEKIAKLTLDAVDKCVSLAEKIPQKDAEAAGAVME